MRLASRSIEIKSEEQIAIMREVGALAADTLVKVAEILEPGITTNDIDAFVHEDTLKKGATPAPLNYHGFPKSVCTSINEVVCHGIPSNRRLKEGDIINVDVTHLYKDYHGDTSATFYIGEASEEARRVTEVARRSLELAILQVKPGNRFGDIGAAIQEFAEAQGCSVVRDFVGHGIGRKFHDEPKVSHVGNWRSGRRFQPGMTFTIEPMINTGTYHTKVLQDGWTAITVDGGLSAQFEHTILVTEMGHEVLTQRRQPLKNSEIFPDYFDRAPT